MDNSRLNHQARVRPRQRHHRHPRPYRKASRLAFASFAVNGIPVCKDRDSNRITISATPAVHMVIILQDNVINTIPTSTYGDDRYVLVPKLLRFLLKDPLRVLMEEVAGELEVLDALVQRRLPVALLQIEGR